MDEKELRAFIVTAEELSISASAEILDTSQSVMSKRIATLESTLGAKLFDRLHSKLVLTNYGRIFLPYAMSAINSLVDGKETVARSLTNTGELLKVGIVEHIAYHLIPDFLAMFNDMHPEINLSIWYMHQYLNYSQLTNHAVDLLISGQGYQQQEGWFNLVPLWKQELVIVVPKDHPLAKIDNPSLEEILEYPAIATPDFMPSRQILEKFMLKHGYGFNPKHEADMMPSLIQLAKQE